MIGWTCYASHRSYRILKVNMDTYPRHMLNDRDRQSEYVGMDFANPLDLAAIGQALGVAGERVEDPQAMASVVQQSFDSGRPAVIDVSIDGSL